jgi:secreted PhoX family phosphatase
LLLKRERWVLNNTSHSSHFFQDGGAHCGVHGRDSTGNYFTIIDNDPDSGSFTGETTGLAFSPDGKRMYVAFQKPGIIFEFIRTDGFSFGGDVVDIKYHAADA